MVCHTDLLCLLPTHDPIMLGTLQFLCISVRLEEVQDAALASVLHADRAAHSTKNLVLRHAVRILYRTIRPCRHDANHQDQHGDKPMLDAL